jgi:Peptidase A4 family
MLFRRLTRRAAAALAAGALTCAVAPAVASANSTSANWAGYVAHGGDVRYRTVTASWTVPSVTCSAGARGSYSADWIGIGGYHTDSSALEQVGTEADCSPAGNARYTAWYELVPSSSVRIHHTVEPGDQMSARVSVHGKLVFIRLSDLTRGTTFTKNVRTTAIDTTSAEWIVEAPSECVGNGAFCRVLPLAQFGDTTFTAARAVSATGHAGAISDPRWRATAIDLQSDGHRRFGYPQDGSSANEATATTGALTAPDSFTVSYAEPAPAPAPARGGPTDGGPPPFL